jgi:hypothetical protein
VDKAFILAEIQRTAAENQGRPLGFRRFSVETGIRDGDWLGKYWPRWGDALREAGFEANTLRGALEGQFLLERYAQLVRELGHLPVRNELRMKAHRDPTFPNDKTILARVGARDRAVPRVIEYCLQTGGWDDVVALCRAWQEEDAATKARPEATGRSEKAGKAVVLGHVYLLKFGRHYKIGRSNAVGRRERELAIQLPQKGNVVHQIATDDPPGIEAYWHRRFEAKRGNGEWFNLTAEDVAAFRRRRSM